MTCIGLCINVAVLSSHKSVFAVPVPSFNGSHQGRSGQKTANQKHTLPSGDPPNYLKDHLSASCSQHIEKRKSKWLVSYPRVRRISGAVHVLQQETAATLGMFRVLR